MVMWEEQAAKLRQFDELAAENARLRERVAELFAENRRLQGELDEVQQKNVLHCPKAGIRAAMAASKDEPAGTIMRATDDPGLAFELGEDGEWWQMH